MVPHALEQRQRPEVERGGASAGLQQLVQVPGQPEAGHVRGRVHAGFRERGGAGGVQLHHGLHGRAQACVVHEVARARGHHDAGAQRLGQVQRVARQRSGVAHDAVGVHGAEHGQAVLRLRVVDGVAPGHERARLAHGVRAAAQDVAGHARAQRAVERQQVQRHVRGRAHGEHVGERVGRRDAPEHVGVVHDGREEVHGEHGRGVVREPPHGGVVARVEAEQQPPGPAVRAVGTVRPACARRAAGGGGKRAQYVVEVARTPLGRSAALRRELRQPDALDLVHGASFRMPRPAASGGPLPSSDSIAARRAPPRRARQRSAACHVPRRRASGPGRPPATPSRSRGRACPARGR